MESVDKLELNLTMPIPTTNFNNKKLRRVLKSGYKCLSGTKVVT